MILPPASPESRPVRRPKKKKRSLKPIIAGAAALILVAGLAVAWACGLFAKDVSDPDGLVDKGSKPAVGLNEDDTSSETVTEYGSFIEIGSSRATVLTAGYDDAQIYILLKAVPASSDLFLIPENFDRDDSTDLLTGLNGIPEGTIDQYSSYLGRTLAKSTFSFRISGATLAGDLRYAFGSDASLYYCFTAALPNGGADHILITGSFYQDIEEASDTQTAELAVKLDRMPDAEQKTVTSFAATVSDETKLTIDHALIEKTGIGYHATFEIVMDGERDLLFLLTDSNGEPLPALPGYTETVTEETADGSRTFRVSCQIPETADDLYFTVTDQDTGIEYGPYAIK